MSSMNETSEFRTFRGYQMRTWQEGHLTPALEDYLEMAYRQCAEKGHARVGRLSKLLNVRPSSASKMISKLSELGYLEYGKSEVVLLTEKGRAAGAYLLWRHETLERFLQFIGSDNPLVEAEIIEHALSEGTISELDALLDFFLRHPETRKAYEAFKSAKKDQTPPPAPKNLENEKRP